MNSSGKKACRLCLEDKPLKSSHIIPAWAFDRFPIQTDPDLPAHPVMLANGYAKPTSDQQREHLLCGDCEERIGKREARIARLAFDREGNCPFYAELGTNPRAAKLPSDLPSLPIRVPATVDAELLTYFAVSVVWRSHVASRDLISRVSLGTKYAELVREYLYDRAPLPTSVLVVMHLLDQIPAAPSTVQRHFNIIFPSTIKRVGHHAHVFMAAGLYFEVYVGNVVPPTVGAYALTRSTPVIILSPADRIAGLAKMPAAVAKASLSPRLKERIATSTARSKRQR